MFSIMYGNSVFLLFWQWVIEMIWVGSLRQYCVFIWFWNGDDCGTFPKMGYCVSVKGNVVHVCKVFDGKWP